MAPSMARVFLLKSQDEGMVSTKTRIIGCLLKRPIIAVKTEAVSKNHLLEECHI